MGMSEPPSPPSRTRDNILLSRLIADVVQTKKVQDLVDTLVPEIARLWAGQNYLKKILARYFEKRIRKSYEQLKHSPEVTQYTTSVVEEPEFISALSEHLITLLNDAIDIGGVLVKTIEKLPSGEKERLLGDIITSLNYARSGELLTIKARIINEIHERNPTFFAERIGAGFNKLIEQIDFGEIKDLVDNSAHDAAAALKVVNDILWQYPSKAVCLISLLPTVANLFITSFKDNAQQLNNISPDLLTDVVLSLIRHIDGKAIGGLINELAELARKLHTGSALLGDPNMPQFPRELSRILGEIAGTVDGKLLWKARVALAEGKESVVNTWIEAQKVNPDLLMRRITNYPSIRNAHMRALSKAVASIEELPEREALEAIAHAATELDMVELAEIVNLLCTLANRIRETKPDFASSMVAQFAHSLDVHEFHKTVKWLAEDLAQSFKPLARAALPHLLNALCDYMKPEDDPYQKDMDAALASLRKLLGTKE